MFSFITNIIYQPLLFFYGLFGGNLGLSIIALTLLIKVVLLPLVIPTIKSAKKMQDLKPALDKLKSKHTDKAKLQQAQLELYKQNGINPAAGCLPQIVQIIVLIALYQVFMKFLGQTEVDGIALNPNFLYLNLNKPDQFYILPILAGITQFIFSLMMQSGIESHVKNPKSGTEKKKEEDSLEMAASMQTQMVYMMPIMTSVISINFQSGLVLYWVISTLFSIVQQYYFSGWGGLKPFLVKLKIIKVNK
ncbi:MAG: Membrane protein insertase YidC [Candidatus Collierbacteria bacterium GW2011_GWF1_44_12]|uniref:Membrane protein insertase YidC n=3 Tax=Candidatus Collieribacteriota TaxID=1752725 RepID=A0A0G1RE21_9BACT|nr:MAG: Membrane protein insertase YidC [Candidatus Collierbacteria bacterium GW2011_GWA1_44_12]KKT37566.1 MAG: Membrane protein insertase YidC [Candidatus Collierbacteria bacterium GW2011_GWF1_44_12]KKU28233.1 MAG: Membrane protein insertase YidC [Candidatus Collierbacteria bacterium GW2011_GWE1_46_18]